MSNCAVLDHPFVLIYATGGVLEDPMTFPSIKAANAWASAQDWDEDDACRLYEVRDGQMHCLLRFDDITDPNLFTRQNINDLPDRVKAAILADWAEQRPMLVRKVKLTDEERLALIDYFNDAYWNTAVPPEFYAQEFFRVVEALASDTLPVQLAYLCDFENEPIYQQALARCEGDPFDPRSV